MLANTPVQKLLNRIPTPFRNKYFLALAVFAVWMAFIDKHDILTQVKLHRTVNKLEADKAFYQEKIEEEEARRADLEVNAEKYAREAYYMKKSNEDVFIIVKE